MGAFAREFSKEGLGSPTSLRDMYRDITLTPRDPFKLFDELSDKFPYEKLKTVIHFPAPFPWSRPSLKRAFDLAARTDPPDRRDTLFAGHFRHLPLFQIAHAADDAPVYLLSDHFSEPPSIRYFAKQFVKFLAERFMSPEKILQASRQFGISEEAIAQVIVFYANARGSAPNLPEILPQSRNSATSCSRLSSRPSKTLEDQLEEEESRKEKKKRKKRNDDGSF